MTMASRRALTCCLVLASALGGFAADVAAQSLSQLLLSSPWCTFSYSQTSGTSRSQRYLFHRDGTYSVGSQRESLSSGRNGSAYGASQGQDGGQWAVQGNLLQLVDSSGESGVVAVQVKRNSNGYPIIVADGIEYSQCR